MALKSGKDEIEYLLSQVFKKYETETGSKLNLNTNRRNYEDIARMLSNISNQLPFTAEELGHGYYPEDRSSSKTEYPYQKYDVTGGQIKDAYNGLVAKPRSFLVDACYIYLYAMGRNRFEENIADTNLLETEEGAQPQIVNRTKGANVKMLAIVMVLIMVLAIAVFQWMASKSELATLKKDLVITPYQPTQKEIAKLEGVWMVYIGSPQARKSDSNRFHKFVRNIVNVKYKDGYFLFNRYGAGFDHYGYMQYESPDVISIRSYVKGSENKIEAPRLSLMRLSGNKDKIMVISASWNFDAGANNDIIGIREVYIKQGNDGEIKEVINTMENHACNCKIVQWKTDKGEKAFYLRNEFLDTIKDEALKKLIDENSILLRYPDSVTVLKR
ncbi:hypothetical protein [Pedobacter xixiisoli]|uniref:Uncharacterized protein n=1 Tax=Pedobacter xixiisoli TaxID=1476464 RepID=A0A286AEE9_9SPHI|nr:hypothetical protein [Pedobacter xixiisoli]SOD20278.1 hypothetical protein SAMN06297358_3992 [Pedobacter xixiisoli]